MPSSYTPVVHQFSLFSFSENKPMKKVPISAARIREAKALMAKGNTTGAAAKMREVREALEDFEQRIH